MSGALGVLADKTIATFADLAAVGGSGSCLANLVTNRLAKRVDKGGEKLWSITGDGRKALKSGHYNRLDTASPAPSAQPAAGAKSKTSAKPAGRRKLAGV